MKKVKILHFSILFALFLLFITIVSPLTFANDFVDSHTQATVIEVIDVNAIRVMLNNGRSALVRLIGIAPNGSPNAAAFLSTRIMGQEVILTRDNAFDNSGRWNYMYVFHNDEMINAHMVLSGFARLNEAHAHAAYFLNMQSGQSIARSVGLGMFAAEFRPDITRYGGSTININTATAAEIIEFLQASPQLASAIVAARTYTVFQNVNDVKFVDGVGREFFSSQRFRMSVSTNINTAALDELASLEGVTHQLAQDIINSRINHPFLNLNELITRGFLNQAQLNTNFPFMSTQTQNTITFARPNFIANINTANHAQMIRAGIPANIANQIITQRANGMPYRNLMDIIGMGIDAAQINQLADNMRTHTNINIAPLSELESLFGNNANQINFTNIINARPFTAVGQISAHIPHNLFEMASPYMYINERQNLPNLVNINRATAAQLVTAGLETTLSNQITTGTRPFWQLPSQLPAVIPTHLRRNLSLFTNINTASAMELLSLDPALTSVVVSQIDTMRNDQPFGSMAEIREFFESIGHTALYSRIYNVLIFR